MKVNEIYNESCLETLAKMPDAFLDCVITSPPYWQLRDYGYEGQWGLEPTFNEYLEHLWALMDAIHLKLKDGGTVWINLGDTYMGGTAGQGGDCGKHTIENAQIKGTRFNGNKKTGLPNKSLCLIPHRFAIGCIDRGWIIRNDIIWAKRNGMPESVTDRFSKKHEYFFFMVKSEKYYFDLDAIRDNHKWSAKDKRADGERHKSKGQCESGEYATDAVCYHSNGKNPGSVSDFWDIPTKPSSNKHYASYNDALITKPILAGCPEGGVIYDPFMGTGSTAEAALRANRKYIGSEMSKEYCQIAEKRLEPYLTQTQLF